jgi:DNA polymerase III subunit epsilon
MARAKSPAERAFLEAPLPPADAPWREVDFTVVDLELTGLDPAVDEIISFAAITVAGGRVRLDDACYRVVRPRRMPSPETVRIHGLRENDLAGAPSLDDVFDDLLESLTGRALVAHVASVETAFLREALAKHRLPLRNPVVDTANLGLELRRVRRQPPLSHGANRSSGEAVSSPGLSDLARSLGLPVHRPHHADGDALTTAQVFIAIATHLEAFGEQTLGSLERSSLQPVRKRPSLRRILRRFVPRRGKN